jgi:hypothetical protein
MASGLYVPRGSVGALAPGRMLLPADAGTSTDPVSQGRGFIPPADAGTARNAFRQASGNLPWVPTSPAEIGNWAKEQTKVFSSREMAQKISNGARVFEQKLSGATPVEALLFSPMTEAAIEDWVKGYVAKYGFPTNSQQGIALARSFVVANCDEIGLPPEFIAAASLIEDFPDTPDEAVKWAVNLGISFLAEFGVPIVDVSDASSFISASAHAAVAQIAPGVPFELFEATFEALSDGRVTKEEAKGIVIGAAGFVGAIVGQAFGLPAPIGALLGQLLVGGLGEAFGWGPTDSDRLKAAQDAASAAAATARQQCTDLSVALWLEYQHYWDSIATGLDGRIRQNQEWLTPTGACTRESGIRLFDQTTLDVVRDGYGNPIVANPAEVKRGGKAKYRTYPYTMTRSCGDAKGCPYVSMPMDRMVVRDKYALTPEDLKRVPEIRATVPSCDATSALLFWGARRYVTPMQVFYAMQGKPEQWVTPYVKQDTQLSSRNVVPWEATVHSDYDYLSNVVGYVGTINFGTAVGQCAAPAWAAFMFRSLEQAAAAVALVQRDLARTVSAATTEYGIQYHLEQAANVQWQVATAADKRKATRQVAAQAAGLRHMVIEAKRRGREKADLLNYGLLAAGGAAVLGLTLGKK